MDFNLQKIRTLYKKTLDFIFPSNIYCICCGNLVDKSRVYALCDNCLETIHWANERSCSKCGKILVENEKRKLLDKIRETEEVCSDCKNNNHFFERGFTCMQYGLIEKEMIHKFKFNGHAYMGDKLGKIMLDRILLESLHVDMVTSVPMHPKKQVKRGYNQSELMAKVVAKGLGVGYNNRVLIRNKYNAPMNKLDAKQRYSNIKNSYGISNKALNLNKKHVLLIDDIYTTGSTVDECSRILIEAGAGKVYVLTLAAGTN